MGPGPAAPEPPAPAACDRLRATGCARPVPLSRAGASVMDKNGHR
jgi:hypothetical protein